MIATKTLFVNITTVVILVIVNPDITVMDLFVAVRVTIMMFGTILSVFENINGGYTCERKSDA